MTGSTATPIPLRELDREPSAVLIVDDDEPVRNALSRFLSQEKFEVVTAANGEEAVGALGGRKIGCALVDVRLPDVAGTDLVPRLLEREPVLAILMLTAVDDATTAALCMQRGALDYLVKPVDLRDLLRAVQHALRRRDAMAESRQINRWLKQEVDTATAELQLERERLQRLSVATLEALVNALEAKDPHLRGHSTRVAELSARVARAMALDESTVAAVRVAGRLHDIGKIGIREDVLGKQGPLTDEEFEHIQTHVDIGAQILAPLTHLEEAIAYVRSHHEHWNGGGYPHGLAGEDIPIGARIICAAEIYDALTTSRAYQRPISVPDAASRLQELSGSVLDPAVVGALVDEVTAKSPR